MKLHDRLILNKYLLSLFGVDKFADLRSEDEREANLREVFKIEDNFDNIDFSSYINIILNSTSLDIDQRIRSNMGKYDRNIMEYVNFINQKGISL